MSWANGWVDSDLWHSLRHFIAPWGREESSQKWRVSGSPFILLDPQKEPVILSEQDPEEAHTSSLFSGILTQVNEQVDLRTGEPVKFYN